MITVYNTITREKEELIPMKDGLIKMYACGVTVYDVCHIGHARQAIVYDVIRNYLVYKGYNVVYVRNYTDVDDKIIARARELGVGALEHSANMIIHSEEDLKALGVKHPDISPKVSLHIQDIIEFIEKLIQKGFAYATPSGDVYYSVKKFKEYGKLSNKNVEELIHGVRNDISDEKKDPLDFALWKSAKEGEIFWESKWGKGRPGWHIECSTMSMKYLGQTFDIHGGGKDLIFPHHENEIAQSEAYSGQTFAKYWLHNGLITVDGRKMSKSFNNFLSIKDALAKYHPEAIRFCILSYHYSSDIDLREKDFEIAERKLFYINTTLFKMNEFLSSNSNISGGEILDVSVADGIIKNFEEAMDNDFNTALALSNFFKVFRYLNQLLNDNKVLKSDKKTTIEKINANLRNVFDPLGLLVEQPEKYISELHEKYVAMYNIDVEEVRSLIEERSVAKDRKDYTRADEIRGLLDNMGIMIKDNVGGRVTWEVKQLLQEV